MKEVSIHLIYGAVDDYMYVCLAQCTYIVAHHRHLFSRAPEIKKDVINNAAGGAQNLGSVARVAGAGHLVSLLCQVTSAQWNHLSERRLSTVCRSRR